MTDFRLILIAPDEALCHAWRGAFGSLPDVEIVSGYFEQVPEWDCVVSPANSFGLMDGGVDAALVRFFGGKLAERVQARILEDYLGEQPVGTSFVIETGHAKHPYLAHTPTMRVPMPIAKGDNVYRAMWALLLAVRAHNAASEQPIQSVLCPGLGTGTGRVPPDEAARQMSLAYKHFRFPPRGLDWSIANARQNAIRRGGDFPF